MLRERVEKRVRGGVVALAAAAQERRGRRERDQLRVRQQLVQVPGRIDLRAHHALDLVGRQRLHRAVLHHAGGVDDHPDRRLHGPEQIRELLPVQNVACGDSRFAPQAGELLHELARPGRIGSAPAHEQQAARAVTLGEVACDEGAEPACPARDQDGAVDLQGPGVGHLGDPHQPRCVGASVAHRDLGLASGQEELPSHVGLVIEIDRHEAARVLGLGAAHQAQDGGDRQVG